VGVSVAVLIAVGIGYFLMRDAAAPGPTVHVDAKPAATPETSEKKRVEPPPIPQGPPSESPAPSTEPPFDALAILSGIVEASDRSHAVRAEPIKKTVRIRKDRVQFRVRSSEGGYVYVLVVGTKRDFTMFFPEQNEIPPNRDIVIPREGWAAQGPAGTNTFLVIVSPAPRDFSQAGLKSLDVFAEFDPVEAERVFRAANGSAAPFAGIAKCPPDSTHCSEAYGAAAFTIDEVPR
jgi:hypothetical protein